MRDRVVLGQRPLWCSEYLPKDQENRDSFSHQPQSMAPPTTKANPEQMAANKSDVQIVPAKLITIVKQVLCGAGQFFPLSLSSETGNFIFEERSSLRTRSRPGL